MIYTLTYNPSIDYLVTVDSLEIGKLNRMRKDTYLYGGKGVNVSQVLKELGIDRGGTAEEGNPYGFCTSARRPFAYQYQISRDRGD